MGNSDIVRQSSNLPNAADVKAWEFVHSILDWMGKNKCYNYRRAFETLAVETDQTMGALEQAFYKAIKKPYVQQRWIERADAREQAALAIIYGQWAHILDYQSRLARGEVKGCQPRDSTAAARFVDEQRKELESKVRSEETGEKRHPAQILLDAYMRPAKLRRTVVTEEIELERSDTSDIIDVTPE